ncbi:circadian clock-controlled protein daywake-like [Manduca sexta]|uniref:circadian clock-controlled protein daywake-like n=1 Tax=Manduca sexta TaxID=7130 RepID=UPI001890873C|nr:circadian clock-controlled protein daywake-like [Manduca sexta]
MNLKYILVIFILVISRIDSITQFRRPCEDLSEECLSKSLQMAFPIFVQGIPELGIESLDPYIIDNLDLMLAGGLSIQFRQGIAKGLKDCDVDFAKLIGNTLETQLHCNLTVKGKYKSLGKLLMFPIDGHGDASIKSRNIRLHGLFKFKSKVLSDGEKYLEIISSNVEHSYDGRVSYHLTNLLRGNPELSNSVLDFMNDNWRMVAEELGGPLVDYGVAAVMKNLKQLLTIIPMNKMVTVPLNL